MQLPKLVAMLFMTSSFTRVQAVADSVTCILKQPDIYLAILDFCYTTNDDLVVPSAYAAAGAYHGNKWVGIPGNCDPPQWVPDHFCVSQMFEVCARAPASGVNHMTWGNDNCQTFTTFYAGWARD
ncbi:hypothetical protein LTR53_007422 [Teratosphaeriaceae sp. CCFEE 6253]|nr:hypothetical protein LTR53_007422 [Teratosphaeriaceae sp. CCFEE 6253]